MNNLKRLIGWLEDIQEDREPSIPYNLHPLIHLLYANIVTHEAIKLLKQLDSMEDTEA